MIVKFRKINEHVKTPIKSTDGAAGFDLFNSGKTVVIHPGETNPISTGIQMEIPKGYAGFIYARSGLGCKHGIVPSNCVGVIDSDYRGEIIVYLHFIAVSKLCSGLRRDLGPTNCSRTFKSEDHGGFVLTRDV